MKQFWIEVYSPPYPNKGKKVKVWATYPADALSTILGISPAPNLVLFFSVWAVNKEDALAEALSGKAKTLLSPNAQDLLLV
jgi:hypothetical protein